jgi:ergothioneine biosynthesis protein EgtB
MDTSPSPALDRDHLLDRYRRVRQLTLDLAAPLAPEDQVIQSMPDASPTKWHLAHTTWFFETFLLKAFQPGYKPVNEAYGYLFNSYYEALAPFFHRPDRGMLSRPTVSEVQDFRSAVDQRMAAFVAEVSDNAWAEMAPLIRLGLHHEQQHQELLLTDVKHLLSRNPLRPVYREDLPSGNNRKAPPLTWIEVEGGLREIGHDGAGFAFDNEGPRHKVYLEPFRIASRPVTGGEFLAFIEEEGYSRAEFWLSNGWATVKEKGWAAPFYWTRHDDGHWTEFTLGGERPLDLEAPASHLSFYEADAFARWSGKRLPTEAEWEVAMADFPVAGNLLETGRLHPAAAAGDGLIQAFGDVWEWTASPYAPYPGFKPAAGLIGEYNGKFMCEQMVLRGGSCVTPPGHVRATYRNFFPCAAQWQFTGVRLAE